MARPSSPCFKSIMSAWARKLPPNLPVLQGKEGQSQKLISSAGGRLGSSPWKSLSTFLFTFLILAFSTCSQPSGGFATVSSRSCLHISINHQERMREWKKETREVEEQEERKKRKREGRRETEQAHKSTWGKRDSGFFHSTKDPVRDTGWEEWFVHSTTQNLFICLPKSVKGNCAQFKTNWSNTLLGPVTRTQWTWFLCTLA